MNGAGTTTLARRIASDIEVLFLGYFALVMATGIVSIAAELFALTAIARALLWINVAAYAVLSLLLLVRVAIYARRVLSDLCDHGRGPGFFTVVAGTCVLGAQVLLVAREPSWPARSGLQGSCCGSS